MTGRDIWGDWRDGTDWGGGEPAGDIRHFGSDGGVHHLRPWPPCNCGCEDPGNDIPPGRPRRAADDFSAQPGAVLLSRAYAQRDTDPLTARERGRDEVAARYAETRTTDGRAALAELRSYRNPDGSRLSGSAALAVVRAMADLGIGGVGHEPS